MLDMKTACRTGLIKLDYWEGLYISKEDILESDFRNIILEATGLLMNSQGHVENVSLKDMKEILEEYNLLDDMFRNKYMFKVGGPCPQDRRCTPEELQELEAMYGDDLF